MHNSLGTQSVLQDLGINALSSPQSLRGRRPVYKAHKQDTVFIVFRVTIQPYFRHGTIF